MAQQYDIQTIKQLKAKLAELPKLEPVNLTLDEVALELKDTIIDLEKKNYPVKQIAEIINKNGVKLTQIKIKTIINSQKKTPPKSSTKTKQKTKKL